MKRVKHMSLHQHYETEIWEQESLKGAPESTQEGYRALKKVCSDESHKCENSQKAHQATPWVLRQTARRTIFP